MPEVKWFIGESEIISETKKREISYDIKSGEATLKIVEPTSVDEVIYRVQATNKYGRAECRANLIVGKALQIQKPVVVQPPKITKPLQALFVTKSQDVMLDVQFEGSPHLEVRWFKNNKEITENKEIIVEETKTVLKIRKVKKEHGGKYEVKVSNSTGEAKTSATLQVTESKSPEEKEVMPPKFIEALYPQLVAEGEVAILETRVESHPTCSFQWFQQSTPIKVRKNLICFVFVFSLVMYSHGQVSIFNEIQFLIKFELSLLKSANIYFSIKKL